MGEFSAPESWMYHPSFIADPEFVANYSAKACKHQQWWADILYNATHTWRDDSFDLEKEWPRSSFRPTSHVVNKLFDLRKALQEPWFNHTLAAAYTNGTSATILGPRSHAKTQLNEMGLALNLRMFEQSVREDHLPMWLRVYSRTTPLDKCLEALRRVDGIDETVLFVSIDGEFRDVLDYVVENVDFVAVRLFWHERVWEESTLHAPCHNASMWNKTCRYKHAINTHWAFGTRLITDIFDYPYVVSLEDDLWVSTDFYRMHLALHGRVLSGEVLALGAYPIGPWHECHYLHDKLMNAGECLITDVRTFLLDRYVVGWGSGVTKRMLAIVLPNLWDAVYDCVLTTYVRQHPGIYAATPCATRLHVMPNVGASGVAKTPYVYDLPVLVARSFRGNLSVITSAEDVDGSAKHSFWIVE